LRSGVEFVATKKGMAAALALAVAGPSELHARSFDQLTRAARVLLEQAIAAGEIPSDIQPENLVRALVGMCYMHEQPGWQASVLRLMDILVDGLCVSAKIHKKSGAGATRRRRSKRVFSHGARGD
jgi:hypothetical protein